MESASGVIPPGSPTSAVRTMDYAPLTLEELPGWLGACKPGTVDGCWVALVIELAFTDDGEFKSSRRALALALAAVREGRRSGVIVDKPTEAGKDQHAVALGRMGGLVGGVARAAAMTPEERSEAARVAAVRRWQNQPRQSLAFSAPQAPSHYYRKGLGVTIRETLRSAAPTVGSEVVARFVLAGPRDRAFAAQRIRVGAWPEFSKAMRAERGMRGLGQLIIRRVAV